MPAVELRVGDAVAPTLMRRPADGALRPRDASAGADEEHRSAGERCALGESGGHRPPRSRTKAECRLCGRGRLTPQEAMIVKLFGDGMDERGVAAELFISGVAIRSQLAHICAKLDITSPTDLMAGVVAGLTSDDGSGPADRVGECLKRPPADPVRLTSQEQAVSTLIRAGMDERQIAAELFISAVAVRSHLAHIQEKVGADALVRP